MMEEIFINEEQKGTSGNTEEEIKRLRNYINEYKTLTKESDEDKQYYGHPFNCNIFFFGPTGSGKSSLISTIYQALHQTNTLSEYIKKTLILKNRPDDDGTAKFTHVIIKPALDFAKNAKEIKDGIVIYDTRGQLWMDQKERAQLKVMINGEIKDNSLVEQRKSRSWLRLGEFWRSSEQLFPDDIYDNEVGLKTKAHTLVLVIDGSAEDIMSDNDTDKFYKDIIEQARNDRIISSKNRIFTPTSSFYEN